MLHSSRFRDGKDALEVMDVPEITSVRAGLRFA